jgi:uncharacterized protein with von Willebrand factor type A (vWA) domain
MLVDDLLPATRRVATALYSDLASTAEVSLVAFADEARPVPAAALAVDDHPLVYESNVSAALREARRLLTAADQGDDELRLLLVLNSPPTAHTRADGLIFFRYPPADETLNATFGEARRCAELGIRCDAVAVVGDESTSERTVEAAFAVAGVGGGLARVSPANGLSEDDLQQLVRSLR